MGSTVRKQDSTSQESPEMRKQSSFNILDLGKYVCPLCACFGEVLGPKNTMKAICSRFLDVADGVQFWSDDPRSRRTSKLVKTRHRLALPGLATRLMLAWPQSSGVVPLQLPHSREDAHSACPTGRVLPRTTHPPKHGVCSSSLLLLQLQRNLQENSRASPPQSTRGGNKTDYTLQTFPISCDKCRFLHAS